MHDLCTYCKTETDGLFVNYYIKNDIINLHVYVLLGDNA